MTHISPSRYSAFILAAALTLDGVGTMAAARADGGGSPPAVARISVVAGDVGVKTGDADQVAAAVNAPVEAGDYITSGADGRIEVELDPGNVVRAGADTQIRFTTLDGAADTVQLAQGSVELRVLQTTNDRVAVQTPSADVVPDEPGAYLVTVDSNGATFVTARSGSLDVNSPQGTQTLQPGRTMQIIGNATEPQYKLVDEVAATDFDRWADDRDKALADSSNADTYVNGDMLGAADLDQNGTWQNVSGYGEVWQPNDVAPDWTPYSDGNWSYEPDYGWTWVAAEPWGWAPYHYGGWVYLSSGWAWVPPPPSEPAVYSPAQVAFVNVGVNVGWVPLAPGEVAGNAPTGSYRNSGRGLVVGNRTFAASFGKPQYTRYSVGAGGWQRFGAGSWQRFNNPARPAMPYQRQVYPQAFQRQAYQRQAYQGYQRQAYQRGMYQRQAYQQAYQRQAYQRQAYRQAYQPQAYQRGMYQRQAYQQRMAPRASSRASTPRGYGRPHGPGTM